MGSRIGGAESSTTSTITSTAAVTFAETGATPADPEYETVTAFVPAANTYGIEATPPVRVWVPTGAPFT